jgi:hypothetical protein
VVGIKIFRRKIFYIPCRGSDHILRRVEEHIKNVLKMTAERNTPTVFF